VVKNIHHQLSISMLFVCNKLKFKRFIIYVLYNNRGRTMDTKQVTSSRSSRLLKGFGLFMGGFLLASSLFVWLHKQEQFDHQKSMLMEISYNLLGFLDFKDGKFGVIEDVQDNAKQIIAEADLNVPTDRFAYVVNVASKEIVWNASSEGIPDGELHFALSEVKPHFMPRFEQVRPLPPKDAIKLASTPDLKQRYEQEYMLSVEDFEQEGAGKFQLIVGEPVVTPSNWFCLGGSSQWCI
jgi:hypothetical protein